MFKLFGFNTTPIFNIAELFWGGFTGGNYQNPVLKYQTTAGLTVADDVAEPVGLLVTNQPPGDGRGVVNYLLNTATLSTQNVTTSAQDYTLFFTGAGTVELSGTATLAASAAGTYTFTATAGTLTVTVVGSVTSAQINAGLVALTYQPNTVSLGGPGINPFQATAGSRPTLGRVPRGGVRNRLVDTDVLATQNATTPAAQMVLSFYGTGTITLTGTSTAGPLVGAGVSDRVSLTFTPTAGTLTLTVSGSVTQAQLEVVA